MRSAIPYGRILKARWWVGAAVVAVALLTAAVLTSRQDRIYRASTTLVVAPNDKVSDPADVLRSLETLERRSVIATLARIPGAPTTCEAAGRALSWPPAEMSRYRVAGVVLPNTNIIRVDVEGPDGPAAARLAEAVARVTRDEVEALYRIYTMRALSRAEPDRRPVHPDPGRNYLAAALVGLALGLAATIADGILRPPPSA